MNKFFNFHNFSNETNVSTINTIPKASVDDHDELIEFLHGIYERENLEFPLVTHHGHLQIFDYLITEKKHLLKESDYKTTMLLAAKYGHIRITKLLQPGTSQ